MTWLPRAMRDGIAGNTAFYLLTLLAAVVFSFFRVGPSVTLEVSWVWVTSFVIALGFGVLYAWTHLRRVRVFSTRKEALEASVQLLNSFAPMSIDKGTIRSTRVGSWPPPPARDEAARLEFRNLLTSRIESGYPVRRIWQIREHADLVLLRTYVAQYARHTNYQVRAMIGVQLLPEVLCLQGTAAAVSIPQPRVPNGVEAMFEFRNRDDIERWERYFDRLWESCPYGRDAMSEDEFVRMEAVLLTNCVALVDGGGIAATVRK